MEPTSTKRKASLPSKPHGMIEGATYHPPRSEMTKQERYWASLNAGGRKKKLFQLRRRNFSLRTPTAGEEGGSGSPVAGAAERRAAAERAMAARRSLLDAAFGRAFAVSPIKVALAFPELDTSLFQ